MKKRGPGNINEYVVESVIKHLKYKDFEANRLKHRLSKMRKDETCEKCKRGYLKHTIFLDCDICARIVSCTRVDCSDARIQCHKCGKRCEALSRNP